MYEKHFVKQRNYVIDFWRIIFCLVILLYHSIYYAESGDYSLFKGGYIGVEFFAIISGYLMVASAAKKNMDSSQIGKETLTFIFGKIKSYMPYWVIFWLLDFVVKYGARNISYIFNRFINSIWSLGFLHMAGIGESILGMGWYIQSMLLVMFILYPICLSNWKKFCEIAAPLFSIWIYAYFAREYHVLSKVSQWKTFFYSGTLRLFAAICLGAFAYYLSTYIRKLQLTRFEKIVMTIIENIGLVLSVVLINFYWNSKYDFFHLFLFFICITLQFSGVSYSNKIFTNKWLKHAGRYSLLLYLSSNVIKNFLLPREWDLGYWKMTAIYSTLTIILSVAVDIVCRLVRRCKYERKKCKI